MENFASVEGMDQDRITVLSETYMISLSDASSNAITLVQDMERNHSVEDASEAGSSTENQSCDGQDFTDIRENVTDELEFCKSSLRMKLDNDYKEQVELPPDLNKFFGLGMPLTKSYATFAQKRRNKRLYLPVPSKLKCNKCYFRTQSHFALKLHIEQNHSDKTWYLCMSCDHTSDTEASMREHVETSIMLESLQFLKSDINDNLSISDKLLKMNDKKKDRSKNNFKKRLLHNGGYICIKGKTNDNQQNIGFLKSNDKHSNEETAMVLSTEKCKNIDKFKNVLGVRDKLNVSYATLAPKKNPSGNGNSKIKCSKCYFRTGSEESLNAHMKEIHFRENLLNCPLCDYTTSDETILNCHLEGHPDVKRFKCPLCEFLTTSKNNFEVHTIKCHLKRYYFCSVCDFGTFESDEFSAHKIIHPPPPTPRTIYRNVNFSRRSIENIDRILERSDENLNSNVSKSTTNESNLKKEFSSIENKNLQFSIQNQPSNPMVRSFRIVKAIENLKSSPEIKRSYNNVSLKRSIQYSLDNNNKNKKQCTKHSSNFKLNEIKLDSVCSQLFKNDKNGNTYESNVDMESDKSNLKRQSSNNDALCMKEYLQNSDTNNDTLMVKSKWSSISSVSIMKNEKSISSHNGKVPGEKIKKTLSENDKNISENCNDSNSEVFDDLSPNESSSKLNNKDVEKTSSIFDELIDSSGKNRDEKETSKCSSENNFELIHSSDRSIGEIKSSKISSKNDLFNILVDTPDISIDEKKMSRRSSENLIEFIDSSDKSIGEIKLSRSSPDNYSCDTSDESIDEIKPSRSSENDNQYDENIEEFMSKESNMNNLDQMKIDVELKNPSSFESLHLVQSKNTNDEFDDCLNIEDNIIAKLVEVMSESSDMMNSDDTVSQDINFFNLFDCSRETNSEFSINDDDILSNFFQSMDEFNCHGDKCEMNFSESHKVDLDLSESHKVDLDLSESHKVDLDLSESHKVDLDLSESHEVVQNSNISNKKEALNVNTSYSSNLNSSFLTNFEHQNHYCPLNLSNISPVRSDVVKLTEDNCSLNLIDMINYDENYLKRLTDNAHDGNVNCNVQKEKNCTLAEKQNANKILDNLAQSSKLSGVNENSVQFSKDTNEKEMQNYQTDKITNFEPNLQENRTNYLYGHSAVDSLSNIGMENFENFNFLFDGITPCYPSSNFNICLPNNCDKDLFTSDKGIDSTNNLLLSENDQYDIDLHSNGSQFELLFKFNNSFSNCRNKMVKHNDKLVECYDALIEHQDESMECNDKSVEHKDKPMKCIVESEQCYDKLMECNYKPMESNEKLIENNKISMKRNDNSIKNNDELMEHDYKSMKHADKAMKYNFNFELMEQTDRPVKLMEYNSRSMESFDQSINKNNKSIYKLTNGRFKSAISST